MSLEQRLAPSACMTASELSVGDRVEVPYRITDDDVRTFAELSGDYNPIHLDDTYASQGIFGRRIAHGVLSLAKFSGIFGVQMPGLGTLWESQTISFLAPVFLDTRYVAIAQVTSVKGNRVFLDTWVEDEEGTKVIEGHACVLAITPGQRRRQMARGMLPGTTEQEK